jgi:hypothetical protein
MDKWSAMTGEYLAVQQSPEYPTNNSGSAYKQRKNITFGMESWSKVCFSHLTSFKISYVELNYKL